MNGVHRQIVLHKQIQSVQDWFALNIFAADKITDLDIRALKTDIFRAVENLSKEIVFVHCVVIQCDILLKK